MGEIVDLKMKVQAIMSSPVITARVDENIVEVAKIMDLNDVGSVII
ncbi:CBS domain-containing protein, partial [Candidatus Bathyarchaeota archaeon]